MNFEKLKLKQIKYFKINLKVRKNNEKKHSKTFKIYSKTH